MSTDPLPRPLLFDGAIVTALLAQGMPEEACTETWILNHPEVLTRLQQSYLQAGAQVLTAPTLGANPEALEDFGLSDQMENINRRLVALTRQTAGTGILVAGELGPTGRAIPPYGDFPFEAMVGCYAQQVKVLDEAGIDLFLVETVCSMSEARAAVLAIREVGCKQPIVVSCYCDEEGRTPGGSDILACAIVMQGMGVSAFGLDGISPSLMTEQLERLRSYLDMPLLAMPTIDGEEPCSPEQLAQLVPQWAALGTELFGGCGGTTPAHMKALKQALDGLEGYVPPQPHRDPDVIPCASKTEARFISPLVDVGTTISCTSDLLEDIVHAEENNPVGALKIAVLDTEDLTIFAEEQYAIRDALCLWSDIPELFEGALRAYQGRAFYDGTAELPVDFLEEMSQRYGLVVL